MKKIIIIIKLNAMKKNDNYYYQFINVIAEAQF